MIRVANALNALSDPRVPNSSFDVMLSLLISLHVVDGVVVAGTIAEFPEDGGEDELTPPRIYPTLVGNAVSVANAMQALTKPGVIGSSSTFFHKVKGRYVASRSTPTGSGGCDAASPRGGGTSHTI